MRAFLGVALDRRWCDALAAAREAVRDSDGRWRDAKWVAPENLHLTLKFLGEMPDQSVRDLAVDLEELEALATFLLPLDRIVHPVPSRRRATMLWTTLLDPEGAGERLARSIDAIASRRGIAPDPRDFKPHITLCRARHPLPAPSFEPAEETARAVLGSQRSVSVSRVTLYRSTLTSDGPIYEMLSTARLAAV